MKSRLFLFLFLIVSSFSTFGQDIIRTTKDTLRGKVEEIGIDEIKYRAFDNLTGPLIVIDKRNVIEITYENGLKTFFAPDPYDANTEVDVRDKSQALKFEFFSPITGKLAFAYERMIKVGMNMEFKAAVIGPGVIKNTKNTSGFFVKAGIKFLTSPTYIVRGVKRAHQLKGFYIKPEVLFNSYSQDKNFDYLISTPGPYGYPFYTTYSETRRIRFTNYGVNIVFGMQHLLGNILTLDYYVGTGYGGRSVNYKPDQNVVDYTFDTDAGYEYSHLYLGKSFPLIITAGLTIGVPF